MFKDTHELMLYVTDYMERQGLNTESDGDYSVHGDAWTDGTAERRPNEYGFENLYGLRIDYDVVWKCNAAKDNTSVDVKVIKWNNSCGLILYKERVNVHMGERAVKTRLYRVLEFYAAQASR